MEELCGRRKIFLNKPYRDPILVKNHWQIGNIVHGRFPNPITHLNINKNSEKYRFLAIFFLFCKIYRDFSENLIKSE